MLPKLYFLKIFFVVFLTLFIFQVQGQIFVPADQPGPLAPEFKPYISGSIDFSDVDGDNDLDVIIAGSNSGGSTDLYLNDGTGIFELTTAASFINIDQGIVRFLDIDGDSDEDLIVAGRNSQNEKLTRIYRNSGAGEFEVLSESAIPDLMPVSLDVADIDLDGDLDLFISGTTNTGKILSSFYENDGMGNFLPYMKTSLPDLLLSGAFADVDADNDPDLLMAGSENTLLYINNGNGLFESRSNSFDVMAENEIAFEDIDNDGDQDVMIIGRSVYRNGLFFNRFTTTIYKNDGTGEFVRQESLYFNEAPEYASFAFADIDGDDDMDVLISGTVQDKPFTGLYENDGSGQFLKVQSSIPDLLLSAIGLADVDLDNDQDVLISGAGSSLPYTGLFLNDSAGNFTEVTGPFEGGLIDGKAEFADFDNDGDQDLLTLGSDESGPTARLFLNDGGNIFAVFLKPFEIERNAIFSIGDLDSDGDTDVVVTGSPTKIYLNDGTGNFVAATSNLAAVNSYNIEIADMDNDKDLDIVLIGSSYPNQDFMDATLKILLNDGSAVFTAINLPELTIIPTQNLEVGDIDGNLTQDIYVSGFKTTLRTGETIFYLNKGDLSFEKIEEEEITAVSHGTTILEDIDGDGDLDLFVSGNASAYSSNAVSNLYINDGSGTFQLLTNSGIAPLLITNGLFADFDNNGYKDLFLSGEVENSFIREVHSYLYLNNGNYEFSEVSDIPVPAVSYGASAFADTDGDGDPDLFVSGADQFYRLRANLFENIKEIKKDNPPIAVCKNLQLYLNSEGVIEIEPEDVDNGSADLEGEVMLSIDKNSFNCNDVGSNLITLTVTDSSGQTASCTATVTIMKITPEVNFSVKPDSQQYSDQVVLNVFVPGGYCSSDIQAAKSVSFYVDSEKIGEAEFTVSGRDLSATQTVFIQFAPGEEQVTAVFEDLASETFGMIDQKANLTIIPENVIVEYTGEKTINILDPNRVITLSASVIDEKDDNPGDIRNARVKFVNRDTGADLSGWLVPVPDDFNNPVSGTVAFDYPIENNLQSLTVGIVVEGYYYRNSAEDDVLITSGTSQALVTGGGKINSNRIEGSLYSGKAVIHFALNAKKGQVNTPQGHLHLNMKFGFGHDAVNYVFKSQKLESLDVGSRTESKFARLVFTGELKELGKMANLSNQKVKVEVFTTDNGEPGTEDSIGFSLFDTNNNLLFSSFWNGSKTNEINLNSGNIVIKLTGDEGVTGRGPKNKSNFDFEVFPNPTSNYFKIRVYSDDNETPLAIQIFSLDGRLLSQIPGKPTEELTVGAGLPVGQYILKISQRGRALGKTILKKDY